MTGPGMTAEDMPEAVEHAIRSRRSIRGFLPTPVPRPVVEHLLTLAALAPSGSNVQPWSVHVVSGESRQRLCEALAQAGSKRSGSEAGIAPDYDYYPKRWREPFLQRRRTTGWQLYQALGIDRGDHAAANAFRAGNYQFFGAPVGIIITLARDMEHGAWLDVGAFLQTLLLAARSVGLHTCPQAAFANHGDVVREVLGIAGSEVVVCGVALGHPDWSCPANRVKTDRVPLGEFATFH